MLFRDHVQTPLPPTPSIKAFHLSDSFPFLLWVAVLFYSFREENLKTCTVTKLSSFI